MKGGKEVSIREPPSKKKIKSSGDLQKPGKGRIVTGGKTKSPALELSCRACQRKGI